MGLFQRAKAAARVLKRDTLTLYLVARHPRSPWYARLLAGAVVAYALSPLDLIPDFIPVVGYLDDLIIVPLGIALTLKLVPPVVLADCRTEALQRTDRPTSWVGAAFMLAVWLAILALAIMVVRQALT